MSSEDIGNEARQKIIAQTEEIAAKQRFALFSQFPPLYLGEGPTPTRRLRNQEGMVIVSPRNIQAGRPSVRTAVGTFSEPEHLPCPYLETNRLELLQEKRKNKLQLEPRFKPQNNQIYTIRAAYPYMPCPTSTQRKERKGCQPRNMTVVSSSRAAELTGKFPKFMNEPYEEWKRVNAQLHRKSKQLMKEPFIQHTPGGNPFTPDSETFSLEKYPPRKQLQASPSESKEVFRFSNPGRKGWKGLFNQVEYMPENGRKVLQRSASTRYGAWKPRCPNKLSRPTPSILTFRLNINGR